MYETDQLVVSADGYTDSGRHHLCRSGRGRPCHQLLPHQEKEREAEWRKYKFEQYKEFPISVSGIVGRDSTPEGNRSFARACNTLHLIGSKGVLTALHEFQDEIRVSNTNQSDVRHDAPLSKLIWEIREDLGIPRTSEASDFVARLWCSGAEPASPLPIDRLNTPT
jgi:hypothetical protein